MENKYECIIVFNPDLEEIELNSVVEELKNKMGEVKYYECLGKKRLSYELKKRKEGIYIIFKFINTLENTKAFDKELRERDDVIKFIIVRSDEDDVDEILF